MDICPYDKYKYQLEQGNSALPPGFHIAEPGIDEGREQNSDNVWANVEVMAACSHGKGQNERSKGRIHPAALDSQSQAGPEKGDERYGRDQETVEPGDPVDGSHDALTEPLLGNPGLPITCEAVDILMDELSRCEKALPSSRMEESPRVPEKPIPARNEQQKPDGGKNQGAEWSELYSFHGPRYRPERSMMRLFPDTATQRETNQRIQGRLAFIQLADVAQLRQCNSCDSASHHAGNTSAPSPISVRIG